MSKAKDFEDEAMRLLLAVKDTDKSTIAKLATLQRALQAAYQKGTKAAPKTTYRSHEDGCRCHECDPSW